MAERTARIEQFQKMAEADPKNELGHFSLGREYLEAGMPIEAAASLKRAIDLNRNLSKAHQLLAQALLQQHQKEAAIARFIEGAKVADERGDIMVRNDIVTALKELGAPVPEFKSGEPARAAGEGQVMCSRCGRAGPRLPHPPFSNALGARIQEKVCADCWREWIGMGTKVINELRLPLSDPAAQKMFDQHMLEFLNLQDQ